MTLEQIQQTIADGKRVFWKTAAYEVKRTGAQYLIVCVINKDAIGLTWRDGVTMNGKPTDFYVGE